MGKKIAAEPRVCRGCGRIFTVTRQGWKCSSCRSAEYEARHPGRRLAIQRAWRAANVGLSRGYQKTYYDRHKDRKKLALRARRRVRNFGVGDEVMSAMLDWQNGRCRVCSSEFEDAVRPPVIDHDHSTGLVRGLLCHPCNLALGNMRDDASLLRSAINYLVVNSPNNLDNPESIEYHI